MDLCVDTGKYMIGLVSRLTDQKGLDLINYCMEGIVDENTQLVVIGTGESRYENMFRHYAWKYPDRVSANICYSDDLARKLYAAADAFLMPSRFEPCGLTQLISFRYGTVPIVRKTGGLKDTVVPTTNTSIPATGSPSRNYNGDELLNTVNYSKYIYFKEGSVEQDGGEGHEEGLFLGQFQGQLRIALSFHSSDDGTSDAVSA